MPSFQRSRDSGRTIVEMTVASAALVGAMSIVLPAFNSVSKAGDYGRTLTYVETDNRAALLKIGRELQNTSLTLTNTSGGAVFGITADNVNTPRFLTDAGAPADDVRTAAADTGTAADAVGGPGVMIATGPAPGGLLSTLCPACLLNLSIGHLCGLPDGQTTPPPTNGAQETGTPLNPADSGSGRRGQTHVGRTRSVATATSTYGDGTNRARTRTFPGNTILTFQKVMGYAIGADGEPILNWSTPITYSVQNRSLLRTQDGRQQIISRNCSVFFAETTDSGTVVISLVSQRRAPATGEVTRQANQVEIRPKN